MKNREEILAMLSDVMVELFETDPAAITPEASLYDDLDIDSIDAVDMVIRLRDITGKKVDPEQFKAVRTVNDVVDAIEKMMA
jgi:acyl carrier protein